MAKRPTDQHDLTQIKIFSFSTDVKEGNDVDIVIQEVVHPHFGLYVWPSAILLAAYLASNSQRLCTDRHVIELGAGTGLPGLVCAKLNAKRVIFTDHHRNVNVLANLNRVLELNNLVSSPRLCSAVGLCLGFNFVLLLQTRCQVAGLAWGQYPQATAFGKELCQKLGKQSKGPLLIGADVFYNKSQFDDLLSTIEAFFECFPECECLLGFQERGSMFESLQAAAKVWGLKVKEVQFDHDLEDEYESLMSNVHILRMSTEPRV